MTQNLKILNSKEIKHIYELLREQYGYEGKLDVAFLLSEKKERVYIFTKDLAGVDIANLRVDTMGMYFGTFFEDKLRITVDGTQMIGPSCTKNIITIDKKEMQVWMQGEKLMLSQLSHPPAETPTGFVIIKYQDDFLGCGKIGGDLILNYVPKTRYIRATYDDVAPAAQEQPDSQK
jgi:NOL1/NOP2/fmu family ribosome biogenesis protein